MTKQLYSIDKEGRIHMHITMHEYRRIVYELKTENVYMNPLIHLIRGSYSFLYNDKIANVNIEINKGLCSLVVKDDNDNIILRSKRIKDLYKFYKVQIEFYNVFGEPLVYHLIELGLLNDENLSYYDAALFYPPIFSGRTEWDVMEIRPDYYIHKMGDEWCLYYWVSGEDEICMDLYESGPIDIVINKFRSILDGMGVKPADKVSKWTDVTYNEDGSFTLTKC